MVWYNKWAFDGRLAQLGEHLPYKQRVTGSSPVLSTMVNFTDLRNGLVAQLVRALACHARGRGFEPHPSRQVKKKHCRSNRGGSEWQSSGLSEPTATKARSSRRDRAPSESPIKYADLAHLVERHLAKVEVAGSSPVIRSKKSKDTRKEQCH